MLRDKVPLGIVLENKTTNKITTKGRIEAGF